MDTRAVAVSVALAVAIVASVAAMAGVAGGVAGGLFDGDYGLSGWLRTGLLSIAGFGLLTLLHEWGHASVVLTLRRRVRVRIGVASVALDGHPQHRRLAHAAELLAGMAFELTGLAALGVVAADTGDGALCKTTLVLSVMSLASYLYPTSRSDLAAIVRLARRHPGGAMPHTQQQRGQDIPETSPGW